MKITNKQIAKVMIEDGKILQNMNGCYLVSFRDHLYKVFEPYSKNPIILQVDLSNS